MERSQAPESPEAVSSGSRKRKMETDGTPHSKRQHVSKEVANPQVKSKCLFVKRSRQQPSCLSSVQSGGASTSTASPLVQVDHLVSA